VVDISNPLSPKEIGSFHTNDDPWDVTVVGDKAYVMGYEMGIQVIDISNPISLRRIASFDTPGFPRGITVVGDRAYVADEKSLEVIDVSNPANPQTIGSICIGWALRVAVLGDKAYVTRGFSSHFIYFVSIATTRGTLQVVDVSNPANSQII